MLQPSLAPSDLAIDCPDGAGSCRSCMQAGLTAAWARPRGLERRLCSLPSPLCCLPTSHQPARSPGQATGLQKGQVRAQCRGVGRLHGPFTPIQGRQSGLQDDRVAGSPPGARLLPTGSSGGARRRPPLPHLPAQQSAQRRLALLLERRTRLLLKCVFSFPL